MTALMAPSGAVAARDELRRELDDFIASAPTVDDEVPREEHVRQLVEYQKALHAAGLAVVSWPERFGGRGYGPAETAFVAERLGEARMPELINFVGIEVLAPAMMAFVDADRLERWLPPMAAAEEIWCQMFSEPDAGSDLANLSTRAEPDGDGWRISGQKVWSTWGQFATWGLVLARTGEPGSRHRGITAFVIDMGSDGLETRSLRTMTGEAEFAEVFLDGVYVGREGLVGEVDRGWDVTMHILGSERGPYAVRRASVLRGALGRLVERARERPLSVEERMAVVRAHESMQLLDHRIAQVVDSLSRGETPGADAALTKMRLTDAEQSIAAAAQLLAGAPGMAWEGEHLPAEVNAYLYSRAASIYGGTAEVQRNIIGERLLGLPREPA